MDLWLFGCVGGIVYGSYYFEASFFFFFCYFFYITWDYISML